MKTDELLELLKQSEVISEIKKIVTNDVVDNLNEKAYKIAEDEIQLLKKQNALLILEKNDLLTNFQTTDVVNKQNIEKLESQIIILENNKKEMVLKCEHYKTLVDKYEEKYYMFNKLISLPEETIKMLNGIFKKQEYENFLVCGCQRENIDALWETIMFRVMSSNYESLQTLVEILLYFINMYNDISDRPTLKIQDVKIGDDFDSSMHIRNPESKTSGKISEVILPGYLVVSTENIVKKSIVKAL